MSQELECSVDYLINEAMRAYAQSRNYPVDVPASQPAVPAGSGRPTAPVPPPPNAPGIPSLRGQAPASRPSAVAPPPPPRASVSAPPTASAPPTPSAQPAPPPSAPPVPPASSAPPRQPSAPPPRQPSAPPPLPGPPPAQAPAPAPAARPPLSIVFNGKKFPINKDEFVIGRGAKSADLPIKDGNISRRHAAVVYHNGAFFLKDLGSTNGVEFRGKRIDTRRIEEGDAFRLCDYELRFTYS